MKKVILALAVVGLALLGVVNGPVEAKAAPPQFPSCLTTKLGADTNRYWFDPGNLTPNIRSVQVEGVNMSRRRDGVWVADAPRDVHDNDMYVYFTYNHSKHKGSWAPCRKPSP